MWTPTVVLIAITTLAACVTLGGGLYEYLVVDPRWPKRPGIIQPHNGGVSRVWSLVDFIPKALAFEKADPAAVDATRESLVVGSA